MFLNNTRIPLITHQFFCCTGIFNSIVFSYYYSVQRLSVTLRYNHIDIFTGYIQLAISVGSPAEVDRLTARLQQDGYPVVDGPRHTGDGYYESAVLDPDGNRIEITI